MSSLEVCSELSQNFVDYAYAVNTDRAIPNAADGLKPVARRILYSMYENKFFQNKAHVKSARIVGDVMGKYHPHGDSSIYETQIRMAQNWEMRYPLIDVHGNCGTVGGDGAAASRYTESRLTLLPEEGMLKNLNKENVDVQPNYSEDLTEPCLLPSVFPNLLCNPTKGIGVAIATEFLPHNLNDISSVIINYIKTNDLDYSNLYPDFPLGGTIVNKDSVHKIYETGKGSVILEANYKEEKRNGKKLLVFTTIPFQVETETLLTKIGQACEEGKVAGIADVKDESDDENIRIVCELIPGADIDKVAENLFSETDLRKNYSANQVALVSKTPVLLNLKQIVDIYIEHNSTCIRKEFEYDADKTAKRIHILEGLIKAINNIDEVIDIIRCDGAPALTLATTFELSVEQVKAILDMKLSRLSKLEVEKLESELKEKKEYLEYCLSVINSEDRQKELLVDRLTEVTRKFGDARRTDVIQKQITKSGRAKVKTEAAPEDVVVLLNKDGYLKSIPVKSYRATKEIVLGQFKTDTEQLINLFSNQGRMFRIKVSKIQTCGSTDKGTAVGSLIALDKKETILSIMPQDNISFDYIMFSTKNGIVKKTKVLEYSGTTQNVKGLKAMNIKDNDEVISISLGTDIQNIMLVTNDGYCLRCSVDDISYQGKATGGVKGITLHENDFVVKSILCNEDNPFVVVGRKGNCKLVDQSEFTIQGRGGKGAKVSGEPISGILQVNPTDEVRLITAKGVTNLKVSIFKKMHRNDYGEILCKQEVLDIM